MLFDNQNSNQNQTNPVDNRDIPTAPFTPPAQTNSYGRYTEASSTAYNNTPSYSTPSHTAPASEVPAANSKKTGKAIGYIASLLVVGLISGAAGGGATFWMMNNNDLVQAPPSVTEAPLTTPAATTPATTEAPTDNAAGNSGLVTAAGGIAAVVEKASESVVEIQVEVEQSNPFYGNSVMTGSGSGVILTADGYIATNDHVVESSTKITVRTKDGTEYEGTLVGTDASTDLAVVKIEAENLKPATFGDSDTIQVGEAAIAIGNPLGRLGGTVTSGIISAKDRELTIGDETMTLIQTSAAINPGNSGGGLFNESADLIGIVNAKSGGDNIEGLGFAIPANLVKQVTNDLIQKGYVSGRPEIGVSLIMISDPQTAFMYRVNEMGLYVSAVTRDNGLKAGDLVVSVDGDTIATSADLKALLGKHNAGDVLSFAIKRDGAEMTVDVTLVEKIPEEIRKRMEESAA